jgi:predicted transposase YbfD/YdcC
MLTLPGAVVTIEAMGCQGDIARQIQEQGADYVLS